ncbi:MAG: hypothetical protein WC495_04960 [Patescibacteria group bacterium]|jgi:hypothetical protein
MGNAVNNQKIRNLSMQKYRGVLVESMQMHLRAMEAGDYSYNNPLFVWGPPGIGKSMILLSICRETWLNAKDAKGKMLFDEKFLNELRPWDASQWPLYTTEQREKVNTFKQGWVLMDVRLSQVDPVEIKGAPMYDYKNLKASFVRFSSILPDPNIENPTFLFLDELPLASEMVQSAGYQLINDRRIGDYHLPRKCQVVSAGNRPEDGGVHNEMSPALVNRFDHVGLDIDYDGFVKYVSNGHGYDETMVAFLMYSKEQDKDALYKLDISNVGNFPTFRSWEKALRKVKYGSKEYEALADSVGQAVAAKFENFKEITKDIPDAETLVTKKIYYEEVALQLVASQKVGNHLLNKELSAKMSEDKSHNYFRYFVDMKNPKDKSDSREELTILFLVNVKGNLEVLDKIDKGMQKAIKAGKLKVEKHPETGDEMKDVYGLIFGKWRSLSDIEG